MFQDEILVCRVCGGKFVFSAEEQEFYAQKGFKSKPSICKACKQKRNEDSFMADLRDPSRRVECKCRLCGKTYVLSRGLVENLRENNPATDAITHTCTVCAKAFYEQVLLSSQVVMNEILGYPR